jgi:hypothetical protein
MWWKLVGLALLAGAALFVLLAPLVRVDERVELPPARRSIQPPNVVDEARARPAPSATSLGVPDEATIAKLEAKVRLPPYAHRLAEYDRYYAYEMDVGRLMVVGSYELAHSRPGQVHRLAQPNQLPLVADGGCSYIHVWWDVKTNSVAAVGCNGLG